MKPFSILLIKVLGLYLALQNLLSVAPILFNADARDMWQNELFPMLLAMILLPIVAGILLWFFAGALANRIHGESEPGVVVKEDELVRAGLFLIGVYLLVQHAGVLMGTYTASGSLAYGSLLVFALGLAMVLGSGFFAWLYRWARDSGIRR
ncbi:hypothetical protein [Halopseudomonas salegens]|uniref:Uncharacterized protein n=1 Tax=Halopseudomonas salegens TaxID=1434072 RepID=A0A1H2F9C4_9GAMM|nr:hypothetical protein [Halopseudomonas salegens]SDU03986.1 hypothetical protein SAMN05216210_1392 [Halopseudomonas salegens]